MTAAKQTQQTVAIKPANIQQAAFRIKGTAPYVQARFSGKAMQAVMSKMAAGAQPATPSTQTTPNWIWSWLMDWCKRRGVPPSNYDSLFQMASDALLLAPQSPPSAPSVPDMTAMVDAAMEATQHIHPPITRSQCKQIIEAALASAPQSPPSAPSVPDVDSIVDLMSEFATHDIERGKMEFDKWTLREAVEAAITEAPKRKPLTDAMVEAAGRALSDRHANGCGCGMDKGSMWGSYSDEFKEQARVALEAAHGIKESGND